MWIDENYLVIYINNQNDQKSLPSVLQNLFLHMSFLFVFGEWERKDIIFETNVV